MCLPLNGALEINESICSLIKYMPFVFVLCKLDTKEVSRIGYNGFPFPHSYSCAKHFTLRKHHFSDSDCFYLTFLFVYIVITLPRFRLVIGVNELVSKINTGLTPPRKIMLFHATFFYTFLSYS